MLDNAVTDLKNGVRQLYEASHNRDPSLDQLMGMLQDIEHLVKAAKDHLPKDRYKALKRARNDAHLYLESCYGTPNYSAIPAIEELFDLTDELQ